MESEQNVYDDVNVYVLNRPSKLLHVNSYPGYRAITQNIIFKGGLLLVVAVILVAYLSPNSIYGEEIFPFIS